MFRAPQILARSCPIRPSLIKRESHLSVLSGCTEAVNAVKERRYGRTGETKVSVLFSETESPLTRTPLCSIKCENQQLRKASFQKVPSTLQPPHPSNISLSVKPKPVSLSLDCSFVKDLDQNVNAVSTYLDFSSNATCPQPLEKAVNIHEPLPHITRRTFCKLYPRNLKYRQHFVRPFSSLAKIPRILTLSQHQQHPFSLFFYQNRALQAAPHTTDTWKYCLSLENEQRCRQRLGPNMKLYDLDKIKQSQSQGNDPAKWASVLVSLCSIQGDPAFLLTLRSSKLKGRHKGDVSFAGGKSDPSDRDVVATALREAREELGVDVASESVWGTLKPLRDRTGLLIAPVIANLGPLEDLSFKPNPGEVEEIFTMSVSHLCNPRNRGYTHFRTGDKYGYTMPVFQNGKHRVWGLTAMALDFSLKLIVPLKQPIRS